MSIRKFFFWLHLVVGIAAGLVILQMTITGVLLTYERQIVAAVERGSLKVVPLPAGMSPIPLPELFRQARGADSRIPTNASVTVRQGPEPVEINAGRDGVWYVDPFTGRILGQGNAALRSFFQQVVGIHRWFGTQPGDSRQTARAITGASNLLFLGLVLSGLYLWMPRQWSWAHLRPVLWFRSGATGKARDFNWHNVFGFWMAIPLAVVIATALPFSYPWANRLVYQLAGSQPPAPPVSNRPAGGPQRALESLDPAQAWAGFDASWPVVAAQVPDWRSISFRSPDRPGTPLTFTIDTGDGGQPQAKSTLVWDRQQGRIAKWEPFAALDAGARLRRYTRFLHTGEALGLAGQTLAGVASAAGAVLVWTGFALAWRRWLAWRQRRAVRQSQRQSAPAPAAGIGPG